MWAGIASNITNVVLNTIFVFVFHWGVFGIALSTIIGRIAGLAYALVMAKRHEDRRIEVNQRPIGSDCVKGYLAALGRSSYVEV